MPKPRKAPRFGGSPAHHNMILANLATELFRYGRIRTTHAKAKAVQPLAERMVTFAKRGDVHSRRQVLRVIRDRDVVHQLFADVAPALAARNGGYTRVLKLGPRKGDAASMALIELVEGVPAKSDGTHEEASHRHWALRRRGSMPRRAQQRAAEMAPEPAASPPEAAEEEEGPQADPAEVEARLVAEEEGPQADPAEVEASHLAEEEEEAPDEPAASGRDDEEQA